MRTKQMLLFTLVGLTLLSASGCSYVYNFDLTVTVVNATDGTPIPGARVTPEFSHSFRDGAGASPTDASGRFSALFWVSISEFDDHRIREPWPLKIERDGFAAQTVNIKPATKPARYGSTTPLNVTVRLEPVKAP